MLLWQTVTLFHSYFVCRSAVIRLIHLLPFRFLRMEQIPTHMWKPTCFLIHTRLPNARQRSRGKPGTLLSMRWLGNTKKRLPTFIYSWTQEEYILLTASFIANVHVNSSTQIRTSWPSGRTDTLSTCLSSSSTVGVQWLQQGNPGPAGASTERAQCRVAAWELLSGRHHTQTQRLWPQQGDGQVVQTYGRPLLLIPTCLSWSRERLHLSRQNLHSHHMGKAADVALLENTGHLSLKRFRTWGQEMDPHVFSSMSDFIKFKFSNLTNQMDHFFHML